MADLDAPFPDRGKEAIRQAVLKANEDIEWNTSSTDLGFELTDTLFGLATTVLDAVAGLQAARDQFQDALAELTARVAAIEAPATPEPDPVEPTTPEA